MLRSFVDSFLGKSKNELLVSVDIGTSAIKVMQLDVSGHKPVLMSAGITPTPAGAFTNHSIVRTKEVGEAIRSVLEANEITTRRAVTAVPGPCAFTKKISIAYTDSKDLANNIGFEASNYIPHSIDAVRLDYQILKTNGKSSMDVLLVAVKNEIIDSFVAALNAADLEPAIMDVDYFALDNMFGMSYGNGTKHEAKHGTKGDDKKVVAIVNIGAKFTSVNIIQNGESLFTGDVGVGGRLYTDALCETLEIKPKEAENAKMGIASETIDQNLLQETLDRTTEHVASELHRQIGFFWNAAATDRSIETIYLVGGASQVSGLKEELASRTGISCVAMDVFQGIECPDAFDAEYLSEIGPSMGVCVGLAGRRLGDKRNAC